MSLHVCIHLYVITRCPWPSGVSCAPLCDPYLLLSLPTLLSQVAPDLLSVTSLVCIFPEFGRNAITQYVLFGRGGDVLSQLSIISLRFIHVVAYEVVHVLLLPNTFPLYGFTVICLSTSPVNEHLCTIP